MMKVTMHQYETMKLLDIFDGEERILSVNWDDQGVIVMTQEDTHIFVFENDGKPAAEKKTASAEGQTQS